jgi:hypothetical protein
MDSTLHFHFDARAHNQGQVEMMEITGKQFSYIVRESMSFAQLFIYLNSCNDWKVIKSSTPIS